MHRRFSDPDPVSGGWFLYALQVDPANPTQLGDYPKFAMWNSWRQPGAGRLFPDGQPVYQPDHLHRCARFCARPRSMLTGGPANAIAFTVPLAGVGDSYSFVAATFRTAIRRLRAGMKCCWLSTVRLTVAYPDPVHARFFHVDFVTPANSTFGMGANHAPNAEITVNGFVDAFTSCRWFYNCATAGNTRNARYPWR